MFDDIGDTESPNLITTNVMADECNDVLEKANQQDYGSSDHVHLLPTGKARRRAESSHSEDDPIPTFSQLLDEGSVYTRPSLFSLTSIPGEVEDNTGSNVVAICNSYNMGARDLLDKYAQIPRAAGLRAEGIHIRHITSTYVTSIMCHFRHFKNLPTLIYDLLLCLFV